MKNSQAYRNLTARILRKNRIRLKVSNIFPQAASAEAA
jgi:hypothetical protein